MAKKRMTEEQYRAVFDRAESDAGYPACEVMKPGVCVGAATQWHHRKLRSQGGGNEAINGLAVCHACHNAIHADPATAYKHGWLVRGFHEPGARLVLRRGVWVELTEEGGIKN
ncbi:HNH endonuclease signature motif containing protein [Corynebacterium auriscanis]|uniref:HNH endonuclease signature motif containing protein n=1 Tax=Corynebacterium auriscanis TaxID=99807 RepID=UPI003CEFE105